MNTLLKLGAEHKQIEKAFSLLVPLTFDRQVSRSIQGTLNQFKQNTDHLIWHDNLQINEVNGRWVSA